MADFIRRLEENLQTVEGRISSAAIRSGRTPDGVTLVAVTKYAQLEWVRALVSLGQRNLGENRPQQLWERAEQLPADVTWHLIGHLQSNKARRVLPLTQWIHSIDSIKLLNQIDRLSQELSIRPKLLLEVNVTGEVSKDGFTPEELRRDWELACACRHIEILGLMTMAAPNDDPETARPAFRRLRELRDELQARSPAGTLLEQLSMGMTADFEVAIEEGATMIRVGSALFAGLGD